MGAGETLGVARVLSTIADHDDLKGNDIASAGSIADERNQEAGFDLTAESGKGDHKRLLADCENAVTCCMNSVDEVRHTLGTWLSSLDGMSRGALADFEMIAGDPGGRDLRPCWEIARCDSNLKEKCPACRTDDRSLFFSPEAACIPRRVEDGAETGTDGSVSPSEPGHSNHVTHKVGS